MKRLFPFIAVSLGLVAQPHAQQMSALLLPTLPGFSLGAGLSSAIANPANSSGGVTLLNGSATAGDCLIWGANGIQDAGSPCVASPIGTNRVTGTGAQSAPTLADRATDFGVTFNLKTDFGAYCDGNPAHDDTAAIQAWLGKAAPGVKLVAPAGACLFSAPLTVGAASHYTIEGAGPLSTEFKYAGTSTTATLLTINAPNTAAVYGVTLRDFRLGSSTTMTGGFALQLNGAFASFLQGVSIDQDAYLDANDGNFCGGIWMNGAEGDLTNINAYSAQNCGDGVRINSNLGATAEVRIVGGSIGSGWVNGIHIAGGFGGVRCDQTNIAGNGNGVLIDTAIVSTGNREFDEGSTCAFDSNTNNGILVNDTLSAGGMIDVAGWVGSTSAGPGVRIENWAGTVVLRGNAIYNNCGSGVEVDTSSAYLRIDTTEAINANGNSSFGTACTTYQSGHSGYGGGVEAEVSTYNIFSTASIWGNHANEFSANANAYNQLYTANGLTFKNQSGSVGLVLADAGGSSYNDSIYFQDGLGTNKWQLGMAYNGSNPQLTIWDSANSSYWLMSCATGGVCQWGETDNSSMTFNGSTFNLKTSTTDASQLNVSINDGAGKGGYLWFDVNGAPKWQIGNSTSNSFGIWDSANSSSALMTCSTGASCTIGENDTFGTIFRGAVEVETTGPNGTNVYLNANYGGQSDTIYFQDAGNSKWTIGKSTGNAFGIGDAAASANWLTVSTGGNATIGEGNDGLSLSGNVQAASNLIASVTAGAGASCTVASTCHNNAGRITVGPSPSTTVVVSFNGSNAWANAPVCFAQDETSAVTMRATSVSTTGVTFTASGALTPSDKVSYMCMGI
ncbi:hypothetical protein [Roseiarcus sp.]|uniref:hypothetical protein n=1 Tax=Roseiarcus sp. TaxID=1969460 RepID=UPI003F9EA6AD